ncbi:MAG TPA: sn-glycerol-3-phosphate ABC transporter permease UgpA [Stellaceae bacterium]|jgi:sn-glycerol 3-phosphate transport system permease protein|nr:sn-glycerol-3-phosphate ABC transporter permease UgpA [Stellaceae bacterium]
MERRVVFAGWVCPAILLMPQLAVTIVFFFWPAGQAIMQSLRGGDAFGLSTRFVGIDNFTALFADPDYLASFGVTAFFSAAVALLALLPGLLLAVMADRVVRGAAFYKTVLLMPYAIAPAIAGVLWMFLFNPSIGVLAAVLRDLGVDWNYLLNGGQAMLLVVLASAWKQISYNFLFFLAGLQAIPASLIEASAIDGATPHRRFWTIVFPLLAPTSFFLLVVNIVYAFFDTFGVIHNVTQGGPVKATEILVYKVWYDGIVGLDYGGSAAQSVVLMTIVIALTAIQFRFIERRVHYA